MDTESCDSTGDLSLYRYYENGHQMPFLAAERPDKYDDDSRDTSLSSYPSSDRSRELRAKYHYGLRPLSPVPPPSYVERSFDSSRRSWRRPQSTDSGSSTSSRAPFWSRIKRWCGFVVRFLFNFFCLWRACVGLTQLAKKLTRTWRIWRFEHEVQRQPTTCPSRGKNQLFA